MAINAGAGGTEAQDWVEILFRMYLRWCESKDLVVQVIDYLAGDEAGIKNVTFTVNGPYPYGFLKSEHGIHRMVRISPFDATGRRHTSFASVSVLPEVDTDIKIQVDEKDLRIDTYRASGPGGQHVNTTDSAVRITHQPTGLVVSCQDEKSQHKNKAKAMKVLRARLLDLAAEQQHSEISETRKNQVGSGDRSERIRTYNFPQGRITDHRIGLTLYKLDGILEGNLEEILTPLQTHYQSEALKAEAIGT